MSPRAGEPAPRAAASGPDTPRGVVGRRVGPRRPDDASFVVQQVLGSIAELRDVTDPHRLAELATRSLCSLGFDRAMVSRLEGSRCVVERFHTSREPDRTRAVGQVVSGREWRVVPRPVSAEVVRCGTSSLVTDVQGRPGVPHWLATATGTRAFVTAPVVSQGRVVGMLHADRLPPGPEVDELDRDILALFAVHFACLSELAETRNRLERLQRRVHGLSRTLTDSVQACLAHESEPPAESPEAGHHAPAPLRIVDPPTAKTPGGSLTPREVDVLRLLAGGDTNAKIARRLVISEGTVKSHVKNILRKLGAANRAEAVSRWFQEAAPP